MSEKTAAPIEAKRSGPRQARWSSLWRLVTEFALIFGMALLLKQVIAAFASGQYPDPLWLAVTILSLQHGLAAGLFAALAATGIHFSGGLPAELLGEDIYSYVGRIAAEPVGWVCVALLIGHVRSRQIEHVTELQTELAEQNEHAGAVADLCQDLRARKEMLERHIAANVHSSNVDIAEAVTELHEANWDNFPQRLTRFVTLLTGAAEFSIYLLHDDTLKLAFQPHEEHRHATDASVASSNSLFAAIVTERKVLSHARVSDRPLLGDRGTLIGPLVEGNASDRVIGMLAITGSLLDDHPEDAERRFSLTCVEISRRADHFRMIENWHAAAPSAQQSNARLEPSKPSDPAARAQNGGAQKGGAPAENGAAHAKGRPADSPLSHDRPERASIQANGRPQPDREIILQ